MQGGLIGAGVGAGIGAVAGLAIGAAIGGTVGGALGTFVGKGINILGSKEINTIKFTGSTTANSPRDHDREEQKE